MNPNTALTSTHANRPRSKTSRPSSTNHPTMKKTSTCPNPPITRHNTRVSSSDTALPPSTCMPCVPRPTTPVNIGKYTKRTLSHWSSCYTFPPLSRLSMMPSCALKRSAKRSRHFCLPYTTVPSQARPSKIALIDGARIEQRCSKTTALDLSRR